MTDEEYQKEYAKAAADLEAAAQATTARGPDGRFVKAEAATPEPTAAPVPDPEPTAAASPAPTPAPAPAAEAVKDPVKDEPDELAQLRARAAQAEKFEKMARDNQAYATRMAQERAQLLREREQAQRQAQRPAILDANPELADAIRYVATDPAPLREAEDRTAKWMQAVERVHPGILHLPDDDELVKTIAARAAREQQAWNEPLEAIRIITEEKLAHAERQAGRRFAAESAKLAQKSAMSVPGAGASQGGKTLGDPDAEAVRRINEMSSADFAKEVRRVRGY